MKAKLVRSILPAGLLALAFFYAALPGVQTLLLNTVFPDQRVFLHPRVPLFSMLTQHLELFFMATALSTFLGFAGGLLLTREFGKPLLPYFSKLGAIAPTLPPSAVLFLAYPFLGFGFWPTLTALVVYTLFPVLTNTLAGFTSLPTEVMDSARGIGMGPWRQLWKIEMPLAAPAILAGVRQAAILNLGTAAIGAFIGAGGLGVILVTGLNSTNPALVFSGSLTIGLLAVGMDQLLEIWTRPTTQRASNPASRGQKLLDSAH